VNIKKIVLLGLEVTKVFFSLTDSRSKEYLNGSAKIKTVNGINRNVICLPHPGILMKKTDNNPWPSRFDKEISPTTKNEIERIKRACVV